MAFLGVVKLASLRCFRREDTVNAVPELSFQYLFGPLDRVVCGYSWTMLTKSQDSWFQRLVDVAVVTRGAGNEESRRKIYYWLVITASSAPLFVI